MTDPRSLSDARRQYFEENRFGDDGGYGLPYVTVKVGPVKFQIPNTAARVRAVRYHDLHHVLTGYATDFRGETEISAWELASGCKRFHAAWYLNLGAMAVGLIAWPSRVWRAFVRGRHTRNLYGLPFDALLERPVGAQRTELRLDSDHAPTLRDGLWFGATVFACVMMAAIHLAIVAVPVGLLIRWL